MRYTPSARVVPEAAVEKLKIIFRRPAFHLFLFSVFSALLGWPLLTIADQGRGAIVFWYLVIVWGLAIVVLALTARGLKPAGPAAGPGREEDGAGDG